MRQWCAPQRSNMVPSEWSESLDLLLLAWRLRTWTWRPATWRPGTGKPVSKQSPDLAPRLEVMPHWACHLPPQSFCNIERWEKRWENTVLKLENLQISSVSISSAHLGLWFCSSRGKTQHPLTCWKWCFQNRYLGFRSPFWVWPSPLSGTNSRGLVRWAGGVALTFSLPQAKRICPCPGTWGMIPKGHGQIRKSINTRRARITCA